MGSYSDRPGGNRHISSSESDPSQMEFLISPEIDPKIEHYALGAKDVFDFAETLKQFNYRKTDSQFDISNTELFGTEAIDVVNRDTKKRLYITPRQSDHSTEGTLTELFGYNAILQRVGTYAGKFDAYDVPRGSRSLYKTLRSGPYEREYMEFLTGKAVRFVALLRSMDPETFGVDIKNLALTHNGQDTDDDDVYLTVVPPVREPSSPKSLKRLRYLASRPQDAPVNSIIAELERGAASTTDITPEQVILRHFKKKNNSEGDNG